MIHNDVKKILIEKVDQQGRNGVYMKDIIIKTEKEELHITLFSNKKETIETMIDVKKKKNKIDSKSNT